MVGFRGRLGSLSIRRHSLVVVLTFITGCADAIGFLTLGGAFSSVMTGNMVLLGLSLGHLDGALAATSTTALASYAAGVLLGATVAKRAGAHDPVWPKRVTVALAVELLVLLLFLIVWEATLVDRSQFAELSLLGISAAAMGIQGSAVQRFGVSGLSSTYLTGTLTTVIAALAARGDRRATLPSVWVLTALVVGAAVGAVIGRHAAWLAPGLLIVPLILVLALSKRAVRP